MSGRNLCFTLNNPNEAPEEFADSIEAINGFKYLIFQKEVGESGTPHYQGYLEFANPTRWNAIKAAVGDEGIHFERRRGTRDQAIKYASKEDTRVEGPWERGTRARPGQGRRTDLMAGAQLAMTGPSLRTLIESDPSLFLRYSRGLQTIRNLYMTKPREPPVVVLLYGPPGTGKTRLVYDNFPVTTIYRKICTDAFFDGYDDQDVLLLDDFAGRASKMALTDLLGILDRYPYRLPVKGSSTPLIATKIYITTNVHPKDWYDYNDRAGQWECVARRINQVVWMPTPDRAHSVQKHSFFNWVDYEDPEQAFEIIPNDPTTPPGNQEQADMSATL